MAVGNHQSLRGSQDQRWAPEQGHTRGGPAVALARIPSSVAVLGVALGGGLARDALHLLVRLERPLVLGGPLAGQDVGGVGGALLVGGAAGNGVARR